MPPPQHDDTNFIKSGTPTAEGSMETNEPKDEPPIVGSAISRGSAITPPSSNIEPAARTDRDCQKCLKYLTQALDRVGSRPQSLLRALGVISHGNGISGVGKSEGSDEDKLYELTKDGRGVMISLENKDREVITDGLHAGNDGVKNLLQGAERPINNVNNPPRLSNEIEQERNYDDVNGVNLGRRFTEAATLLADGIRHSAEDILRESGGVLTTSPAVDSAESRQTHEDKKNITTIAIECMKCGSDTRAEAGARAFVKGPDPLSIVLCSNRLSSKREVDEVLVHELVHIYDVHSRKMDLRDCRQLAYSEVRAAREAECSNSITSFTAGFCVKDKATVATKNMFPNEGRSCVCNVFDEAMRDLDPFEPLKDDTFLKAGCVRKGSHGRSPSSIQQSVDRGCEEPRQSDR